MRSGRSSAFLLLLFWAGAASVALVFSRRRPPPAPPPPSPRAELPAPPPRESAPAAPRLRPTPAHARGLAPLAPAIRCARAGTRRERGILEEMNRARQNPVGYSVRLKWLEGSYSGGELRLPDGVFQTQEGASAVEEAVRELRGLRPRGRLAWSPCLAQMASDFAADAGSRGIVGHEGPGGEGVAQRARRYVPASNGVGENISYGPPAGRDVVEQLVIDDGVPSRGHRKNIFDPAFRSAGVACGAHARLGTLCVIDFSR